MSIDLSILNAEQCKAVTHTQGPYMINAGPGSGKTQVLTHRIAYLIQEKKIPPYHIIALTFTNKAAKEMHRRIQNLIKDPIKGLWIGTFHSLFARLLRIEAQALGLSSDFTIYDRTDSLALIKILIKELQLNDEIYKPNIVLNRISNAKNRLMNAQAYSQNTDCIEDDQRAAKPRMADLFLAYQKRCKQAEALDFDDLLLTTYHLLSQHKELAEKYQQRFQYILVDEFQDTNQVQYETLKILALHQNLCVIGDDAQSIYAFRGATIHNILSFTKHYPEAQTIKLEQNYRSTKHIVQAVNSLIQNNTQQLAKKIFTNNPQGAPLSLIETSNEVEEALYVANVIFDTHQHEHLTYDNFAILYRANSQSRILEEQLRKHNIPYQILGGTSFYQRKEVKDLLAYLRLLVNPNDEQALRRIINFPKRGIGPTTLEKIWQWAANHNLTVWQVLQKITDFMQGNTAKAIKAFADFITSYQEQAQHQDPYTLATDIAQKSGLLNTLYQNKTPEGVSRYENIQELLNAIKSFVDQNPNEENQLANFLQQITLVSSADEEETNTPKVLLMTVHTAKGLEFSYVYIVGMEEKLFPSSLVGEDEIEEERRLFYVALTRAKTKVYLTYTKTRYRFGEQKACKPSRFLKEIDPSCIAYKNLAPSPKKQQVATPLPSHRTNYTSLHHIQAPHKVNSALLNQLKIGKKVRHPIFGPGLVHEIISDNPHKKIIINFEKQGHKTLLLKFAPLEIL